MENNENNILKFSTQSEALSNYYSENYKELRRNRYMSAGANNDNFILINSLLHKSTVHAAAVKSKIDMVAGQGINYNKQNAELQRLIDNIYSEHDLNHVILEATKDTIINNGIALKITLNKDTKNKKISKIERIELDNLRFSYMKKSVLFSQDWYSNQTRIEYPLFNFTTENDISILYVDFTIGNNFYYPIPEYQSAIDYIVSEEYISQHHRGNANNGWFPSFHLGFQEAPPREQRPLIVQNLQKTFQGAKNSGSVFVTFTEKGSEPPKLEPIQSNNNDEKFLTLLNKCEEKIMQAHQIASPSLVGINAAGGSVISNGEEVMNLLSIFKSTYVIPTQTKIINIFNKLAKFNGIEDEIKFNEFNFTFPIKVTTDTIMKVLDAPYSSDIKKILLKKEGVPDEEIETLLTNNIEPMVTPNTEGAMEEVKVNESIKNLTGRQMQGLMRIVNKYNKEQLSKDQAIMMMTAGFGLTAEEAALFINENND